MRLFVALDIPDEIRHRIRTFIAGVRGFAPDVRWVAPDSLHLTLKFIGEQPDDKLGAIKDALTTVAAQGVDVRFRGTGFFPTAKSARVFWIGIEADTRLADLAAGIDQALEPLGIEREPRAFSPHLTLARSGSGRPQRGRGDRPNRLFAVLQDRLAQMPPPDFGTMTAREFFLYLSELSPKGAQYTKLDRFALP
ncbi:MAG TPA: RNA 2',3'-cyclic phosphodiesterase [Terriglobales bacterium]|nr:RNA 2',3'-cyclic phosphodiesterase [Terriglobales bacterium]